LKHFASRAFWKHYESLPQETRKLADEAFARLKSDPHYPSLHFKKVSKLWSARVGATYRALAVEKGDDLIWFWIGNHADYERLIR
jgi:mRNA-degrading endonuclease RelE of RelBE toxin-antitoxin system